MYTLQVNGTVSSEVPAEGFATVQELCNWVADGWDLEYPVAHTVQAAQAWLHAQDCNQTILEI